MQNRTITKKHPYWENLEKDMVMSDPLGRAWIEVEPSAIEANACLLKNLIGENCVLMAVVKADGYGHGAETVARAALL